MPALLLESIVDRVLLAGEPYSVVHDPLGRRIWAMCEKLGHVAFIDPLDHMVIRRTQMAGLTAGRKQVAFSPEGRLAVVPEPQDGCLSLIEGGVPGAQYGDVDDRLELGQDVGDGHCRDGTKQWPRLPDEGGSEREAAASAIQNAQSVPGVDEAAPN